MRLDRHNSTSTSAATRITASERFEVKLSVRSRASVIHAQKPIPGNRARTASMRASMLASRRHPWPAGAAVRDAATRGVLARSLGIEVGMSGDDRVHRADNLVGGLARSRRVAQRNRQRIEEPESTLAVAQITGEDGPPAEFSAGDMRAPLALLRSRQRGVKLVPVDRRHALKTRQNEDAQMLGHGIGKADTTQAGQTGTIGRKGWPRVDRTCRSPAAPFNQRITASGAGCSSSGISVQRPALGLKPRARRRSDDKLDMAKRPRQDLLTRLFGEGDRGSRPCPPRCLA